MCQNLPLGSIPSQFETEASICAKGENNHIPLRPALNPIKVHVKHIKWQVSQVSKVRRSDRTKDLRLVFKIVFAATHLADTDREFKTS